MNKWHLSMRRLATIGIAIGAFAAQAQPPNSTLEVSASPIVRDGVPVLTFAVTNKSASSIAMYESALPWGNHYSVTVLVVPKRDDPLRGIFPIDDDFGAVSLTLRSGESRTGEIIVSERADRVSSKLGERDLIVFWHYEPKNIDGQALGEFGGWVMFAKH